MKAVILGLPLVIAACSNCSGSQSPATKTVETVAVDTAVCILQHLTETPEQIAVDCGSDVANVQKVITAHKAAETKGQ